MCIFICCYATTGDHFRWCVKRRSNNQPVDELYIENIAMDREGANIWLECFVNDEQMIEKEPKVKQHLDESEKKLGKLSMQLEQKRNIKK